MQPLSNEGIQSGRSKASQYFATFAATLLAFSGGTVMGWSSPALHMYNQQNSTLPIHPTSTEGSWISSVLTIGALIGGLPAGSVANLLGRKLSMLLLAAPFLLSWGIILFANTVSLIYVARLIAGVGVGAMCTVVPMYIAEIAENNIRGILGSTFQLQVCCGILFTYAVGALTNYYKMAMACACIPIFFIFALLQAPETPTYLMKRGRKAEAERSLKYLRGTGCNVDKELHAIENEMTESAASGTTFMQALARRGTQRAVAISLGMMVFQQLSGINIVIFYASKIFDDAGVKLDSQICAILVGLAQVVATVVSVTLIEKAGRKILLQISAVSMAICLAVLGYYFKLKDRGDDVSSFSYVPIVAVITYILLFAIGFGPIPWLMSGEVLSDDIKGVCTGIAVSLNWALAFLVTFSFQSVVDSIGNAATYWLLAAVCVVALVFVTFVVIETKGKSLHEIQEELARRSKNYNVHV